MSKKPQVVETVTQIKTLIRDNYFNLNCCKGVGTLDKQFYRRPISICGPDQQGAESHKICF